MVYKIYPIQKNEFSSNPTKRWNVKVVMKCKDKDGGFMKFKNGSYEQIENRYFENKAQAVKYYESHYHDDQVIKL